VSLELSGVRCIGHGSIYKYTDGRLTKTDVSIMKGTRCFRVKNGIYLFGSMDSLYHTTKLQFKRNGRELFFEQAVTWAVFSDATHVAINDNEFFTIAEYGDDNTTIIFRIKYGDPSNVDTIKIEGYCPYLLDAANDRLYYIVEYPDDPNDDYYGPLGGSLYRMSLIDGSIDEIVKNVSTENSEETAIATDLNVVYSGGILVDYSKNNIIQSQNLTDNERNFFSYEHNAFVDYKNTSNINEWECYHLALGGKLPTALRAVPCFKGIKGTK